MKKISIFCVIVFFWVGCVRLPAPNPSAPADYQYGVEFRRDTLPYDIRWWRLFEDEQLNRLEERALRQNLDLALAASRVDQVRQARHVSEAQYLPSLGLSVEAQGEYAAQTGIEQRYTIAPELSWEIPLFGSLRETRRAARAQILETEWAFRGVVLSLTAEVATTYFNLVASEREWQIAEQTYHLRTQAAALNDSLYRYGMVSRVVADQAHSLALAAASDRAGYERQVVQQWLSLLVLLGEEPAPYSPQGLGAVLWEENLPAQLPVGLPSDLLHRRPDVMQALYALDGAAANVGLARAARFPALTLTLEGGVAADDWGRMFEGKPWIWSAVGSLVEPIFAFGKLRANEAVAREEYYQAVFDYRKSFLQALSDVEQSLVGISTYRRQVEESRRQVQLNEAVLNKTRALYRNGMAAYLDVIDAERTCYESQLELVNLSAAHYIAYIDLFKALGGGW